MCSVSCNVTPFTCITQSSQRSRTINVTPEVSSPALMTKKQSLSHTNIKSHHRRPSSTHTNQLIQKLTLFLLPLAPQWGPSVPLRCREIFILFPFTAGSSHISLTFELHTPIISMLVLGKYMKTVTELRAPLHTMNLTRWETISFL